jgi:hypothetical protein
VDLLVEKSRSWIEERFYENYSGRFCRLELNEKPGQAGEGDLVLFSDGDRVYGEARIEDVKSGFVRLEPLTPVVKPNPEEPPGYGFEYVDAGDCGKYSIELGGKEHVFETFHDLTRGILEKRPPARNRDDVFCHVVWSEVQSLDLNSQEEFLDRMSRSEILSIRNGLQIEKLVYPPTGPDVVESRYRGSSKAHRIYGSLENYVDDVKEFYAKRQEGGIVYSLDTGFEFEDAEDSLRERKQLVRTAVAGRTFDEIRGGGSEEAV